MTKRAIKEKSQKTGLEFLETHGIKFENIEIKPLEIVQTPNPLEYDGDLQIEHQEALNCIKQGNFSAAVTAYEKLFSKNKKDIKTGNIVAALLVHTGDFVKANKVLNTLLKINPADVIALNNLASNRIRQFDYTPKTEKLLVKAVQKAPNIAEIHHNCGVFYHRQSRLSEALKGYSNAKNLKSFPETLIGLGFICLEMNQLEKAKTFFIQAEKIHPNNAQIFYGLSVAEMMRDNMPNALSFAATALIYDPQNYAYISQFGFISKSMTSIMTGKHIEAAILEYLRYEKARHRDIMLPWVGIVNNTDVYKTFRNAIKTNDPIQKYEWIALSKEFNHEFFWRGVKELSIRSTNIEDLFLRYRHYTLANIETLEDVPYNFLYAFAEMMFFNEYVFEYSKDEQDAVETLKKRILSGIKDPKALEMAFLTLAAFEPLFQEKISGIAIEAESIIRNAAFSRMITYQIKEPLEEIKIKESIKTFGSITNEVSQNVKAQYEDNPYPRWKQIIDVTDDQKRLVDRHKKLSVNALVAGCGTGQQPISAAATNPNMNITAIDITSASLGYAIRKTQDLKIKNIRYLMGDILELKKLNKTFDFIFCSGVLHHMNDPMQGWQVLTDILKPGRLMKIGLYSELARKPVVEARKYIKQHGCEPTLDGIREVRSYIKDLPDDHMMADLTSWNDFYTTSMLRDLIFHVQEHRFTIPKIKESLDQLGLQFQGFDDQNPLTHRFFQRYPDPAANMDLDLWHEFEQEYPSTFVAMYNFTCSKPK